MIFQTFGDALVYSRNQMKMYSNVVEAPRWQSVDLPKIEGARMREVFDIYFRVTLGDERTPSLDEFRRDIGPNLPWADNAFKERVYGAPWNPGVQWANWPWARSASNFKQPGTFSHSYAERYWPKLGGNQWNDRFEVDHVATILEMHQGLRFPYGDLRDVVQHLAKDPLSRQAYLPVWFPEDTGVVHGERVPCSIGYHFIQRDGYFHCSYFIRSCDYVRHFRDDLYMTLRLQLWVLDELQKLDPFWMRIRPGYLIFHCTSLHCFEQDYIKEFGKEHARQTAPPAA